MYNNTLHRSFTFLLWLVFFVYPLSNNAQKAYNFEHIGKEKGLSQGTVNTIFKIAAD